MKIKNYLYAAAIVVIALVLCYFLGCNHGKHLACPVNTDTASVKHIRDTVIIYTDTGYVPKADTIIYRDTIPGVTDTLYVETYAPVDTAAILHDYFATKVYKDSQAVANGYVLINDSVRENRITHREFITHFNSVRDSSIVTLHQPKTNLLYAGIGVLGNKGIILRGVSASLGLKTKSDFMYEVSISALTNEKPLYQGWLKIPIRFFKK